MDKYCIQKYFDDYRIGSYSLNESSCNNFDFWGVRCKKHGFYADNYTTSYKTIADSTVIDVREDLWESVRALEFKLIKDIHEIIDSQRIINASHIRWSSFYVKTDNSIFIQRIERFINHDEVFSEQICICEPNNNNPYIYCVRSHFENFVKHSDYKKYEVFRENYEMIKNLIFSSANSARTILEEEYQRHQKDTRV